MAYSTYIVGGAWEGVVAFWHDTGHISDDSMFYQQMMNTRMVKGKQALAYALDEVDPVEFKHGEEDGVPQFLPTMHEQSPVIRRSLFRSDATAASTGGDSAKTERNTRRSGDGGANRDDDGEMDIRPGPVHPKAWLDK